MQCYSDVTPIVLKAAQFLHSEVVRHEGEVKRLRLARVSKELSRYKYKRLCYSFSRPWLKEISLHWTHVKKRPKCFTTQFGQREMPISYQYKPSIL